MEERFLALGTIIKVRDTEKKSMIVGRGLKLIQNEEEKIFDYGAVPYPEGIIGDQLCYINHVDITDVIYAGFKDEDDEKYIKLVEAIYNQLGK